jgi:hypothetical protein
MSLKGARDVIEANICKRLYNRGEKGTGSQRSDKEKVFITNVRQWPGGRLTKIRSRENTLHGMIGVVTSGNSTSFIATGAQVIVVAH